MAKQTWKAQSVLVQVGGRCWNIMLGWRSRGIRPSRAAGDYRSRLDLPTNRILDKGKDKAGLPLLPSEVEYGSFFSLLSLFYGIGPLTLSHVGEDYVNLLSFFLKESSISYRMEEILPSEEKILEKAIHDRFKGLLLDSLKKVKIVLVEKEKSFEFKSKSVTLLTLSPFEEV
ncbi:hypothetical protein Cgig2_000479 [Carnegiea gigantea]|uniref:Uncharacterized protein n=1 Tax=Carnegiea gigantea TaxID=171969 RepID=A0A9Q1K4T1_9CARY|nr:hypothetical protein Cgig2_000479 [Carnegiea gigantea]